MVINGRVRQACTALVDRLLAEHPQEIELRPMHKFPVVRDLVVDRGRMFATLKKLQAWLPVDSYLDMGPGPRQSQEEQQMAYHYSKCMTCGCCVEACPQYTKIELARRPGESDAQFCTRQEAAYSRAFIGAMGIRRSSCSTPIRWAR